MRAYRCDRDGIPLFLTVGMRSARSISCSKDRVICVAEEWACPEPEF